MHNSLQNVNSLCHLSTWMDFNSYSCVINIQKRFLVRGCYHTQWKFHEIHSKLYNDLKISWIQTKRICVLRDNRTMQATITPVCIAKLPYFNLVGVKNQKNREAEIVWFHSNANVLERERERERGERERDSSIERELPMSSLQRDRI